MRDIIGAEMVLFWGVLLLAFGLSLSILWNAQFLAALQGLLPLLLLFMGAVFLVVGYSERKAARECREATEEQKEL